MKKHPPVRLIIPILLAVVIGGGYWAWKNMGKSNSTPEGTILANGTIEATEIDVSPKVAGRVVKLMVDEGDEVRAGQVIAVLDGEELKAQVDQARGARDAAQARLADLLRGSREEQIRQAQANLEQAEAAAEGSLRTLSIAREAYTKSTELKSQLVNAQAAYDANRSAHRQAQARLDLVEEGPRSEQIDQARANVEQAKAQSINAREDAARIEKLYESGAISGQQRDAAVARRDTAEAALAAAEARLAELLAGSRPEEKEQARAAEAQARAQLEGARQNLQAIKQLYSDRLSARQQVEMAQTQYNTASRQVSAARAQLDLLIAGPTKETIDAARGQAQQAGATVKAAEAMTDYLVTRAPASGTILLKNVEIGEMVAVGMPIVRIANLDSVWVRVYTPLPNLRVKVGDRADVTVDAYPEKQFPGRVTEVAEKPEFTPKNVQTKEERVKLVFGVKVQMENPQHELKPGMPADATIHLDTRTARKL